MTTIDPMEARRALTNLRAQIERLNKLADKLTEEAQADGATSDKVVEIDTAALFIREIADGGAEYACA